MKQSTLRKARGGLAEVPFELSRMEKLQSKLDAANILIALKDLPTIVARGKQMRAQVEAEVAALIDVLPAGEQASLQYGQYDLDGQDYMDYQRSIHDGVGGAIWFDSIEPVEF